MNIQDLRDMPVVTVEQIIRFREAVFAEISRLQADNDSLQAKVDALMLEYCPEEMTEPQMESWACHQKLLHEAHGRG